MRKREKKKEIYQVVVGENCGGGSLLWLGL